MPQLYFVESPSLQKWFGHLGLVSHSFTCSVLNSHKLDQNHSKKKTDNPLTSITSLDSTNSWWLLYITFIASSFLVPSRPSLLLYIFLSLSLYPKSLLCPFFYSQPHFLLQLSLLSPPISQQPHSFHYSLSHLLSSVQNQSHFNHHHGEVVVCSCPCIPCMWLQRKPTPILNHVANKVLQK